MGLYKKLFEVKKVWIKLQRDTKAFNYKYATLSQIQDKLSWVMQEQWLLVTHYIKDNVVITEIRDVTTKRDWTFSDDVDYIRSSIPLTEWIKPQDKGSEITYYRRYNLLSLLDLEVEDDDWKKAQESKVLSEENDLPWIAQENIDKLEDLISQWQHFTMKQVREKYKISRANAEKLKQLWIN